MVGDKTIALIGLSDNIHAEIRGCNDSPVRIGSPILTVYDGSALVDGSLIPDPETLQCSSRDSSGRCHRAWAGNRCIT
jgi:hypothetical protein